MKRRTFIEQVGGVSLLAGMPQVLTAKKTAGKYPIIGKGEYRYEVIHDWAKLPGLATFGYTTHGIAVDSEGMVYITHQEGNPGSVFVFDPDGNYVCALGAVHTRFKDGVNESQSIGHGVDFRIEDGQEFMYVTASNFVSADRRGEFAKLTKNGELVWRKGMPLESGKYDDPKARFNPTNVSFTPDGGFFLGDGYGSHFLHKYNKKAEYEFTFGGKGKEKGQFTTPHGQWTDMRDGTPKTVVADRANSRLQIFDMKGKFLSEIPDVLYPADIDIQGDVMLVPDLHARISLFDKQNKPIVHLGDDEAWRKECLVRKKGVGFVMRTQREKWKPGKFVHPHDACFDAQGNIFVAEWVVGGRVTKLRKLS